MRSYPREHKWWDAVVPEFTPEQFLQNFRVSPESFEDICCRLRHVLERKNTNFRLCVPVKKRIAIALWKLATGSEYRSVSQLFGVGVSTVFNFCNAVTTALQPVHIKFPDSMKLKEMSDVFEKNAGMYHNVLVHGSTSPIIAPDKYTCDYFNRKAVVDGKGFF